MAKVVNYFVFMTYDLHGQWDYDNIWSNPGCPTGNCLRSHINITETENALSMVTKAGAPANNVMVGVTSYGRSFHMADPSCTGPMCRFTSVPGSHWNSDAEPGECTGTSGYISDAEIRGIQHVASVIGEPGEVLTWHDHATNSDIMTWNGNWVAYMSPTTKRTRAEWVEGLNFGGISDWAVDLEDYHAPPGQPDDGGGDDDGVSGERPIMECTADYVDLDAVARDADNMPANCWAQYILGTLSSTLDGVLQQYNEVVQDYDGKFGYYAEYVNELVDPQLRSWLSKHPPQNPDASSIVGKGNRFFSCKFRPLGAQGWTYDGPCPVPADILGEPYDDWDIEYTLTDKSGFEEALRTELGMGPDWIKWDRWNSGYNCPPNSPGHDDDVCEDVIQWNHNYPMKADVIKVPNPKDIMAAALPNITTLQTQILEAYLAVGLGIYDGDELDAVHALATPVFMLAQAVDSMGKVKDIGGKVEDEKKKQLILLIVSVVLMVVPMVGEIGLELAGLAQLARFAFIAGEIGNAALSLADIAQNPEAAPFAIMGMLMGAAGRGMKFEKALEGYAGAKKLMSQAGITTLGKVFQEKGGLVASVISRCVR
jgi:chitinase